MPMDSLIFQLKFRLNETITSNTHREREWGGFLGSWRVYICGRSCSCCKSQSVVSIHTRLLYLTRPSLLLSIRYTSSSTSSCGRVVLAMTRIVYRDARLICLTLTRVEGRARMEIRDMGATTRGLTAAPLPHLTVSIQNSLRSLRFMKF